MQVEGPTDNFIQAAIYWPSGSCLSISFHLRMYICTLSKSQVSEVPYVARFPLRTRRQYL